MHLVLHISIYALWIQYGPPGHIAHANVCQLMEVGGREGQICPCMIAYGVGSSRVLDGRVQIWIIHCCKWWFGTVAKPLIMQMYDPNSDYPEFWNGKNMNPLSIIPNKPFLCNWRRVEDFLARSCSHKSRRLFANHARTLSAFPRKKKAWGSSVILPQTKSAHFFKNGYFQVYFLFFQQHHRDSKILL